jgi:hypothetical protein
VSVALVCSIPSTYPEVVPELDVVIKKGLSRKQREELLEFVNSIVRAITCHGHFSYPLVYA